MKTAPTPAPRDLAIAREFGKRFAQRCGREMFELTLFGSRARGDADEESDLDLFVVLHGDDPEGTLKDAARAIACDLTLEHGLLVSVFVADREFCTRHKGYSFLETVAVEGVRL
jgi:predicted nucleotidyltransferase